MKKIIWFFRYYVPWVWHVYFVGSVCRVRGHTWNRQARLNYLRFCKRCWRLDSTTIDLGL